MLYFKWSRKTEQKKNLYNTKEKIHTKLKKKCTQCSNKCDKCTFELQVERFYVKHKGMDIPTVIYKCKDFKLKEE